MSRLMNFPDARLANAALCYGFFDDFEEFVSGDRFTDTSADTGASWTGGTTTGSTEGGIVTGATGATDNNEAYLLTTQELFLFAADKPMVFQCRAKLNEANTDDANYALGFKNAVAADTITDNGAGPVTTGSAAWFYKLDSLPSGNATTFYAGGQCNGTAFTGGPVLLSAANSLSKIAVATGSGYQTFRIVVLPDKSGYTKVNYLYDPNGGNDLKLVASLNFTIASATQMQAFVGVKAGDTNSEAPVIDYIAAYQVR